LQRFRGELTMLDGRGEGGGGSYGASDSTAQGEPRGGSSPFPSGDLDDEIPF
jgi:single-strand DNA-binding protein